MANRLQQVSAGNVGNRFRSSQQEVPRKAYLFDSGGRANDLKRGNDVKLEDFPKEVLIAVIKQKFFKRKKEFLLECLRQKYMMDFTQAHNKCEKLISENTSLGTSVNDRIKWLKNQNELSRLFKKDDEIRKTHERQNEELRTMKDDGRWQ